VFLGRREGVCVWIVFLVSEGGRGAARQRRRGRRARTPAVAAVVVAIAPRGTCPYRYVDVHLQVNYLEKKEATQQERERERERERDGEKPSRGEKSVFESCARRGQRTEKTERQADAERHSSTLRSETQQRPTEAEETGNRRTMPWTVTTIHFWALRVRFLRGCLDVLRTYMLRD
jgi:hypothetical protein